MADARRADTELTVVQAHRFELIDEVGRVRAVLGDIFTTKTYVPGLALLDRQGHHRTNYALSPWGPMINFIVEDVEVLVLSVNDEGLRSDTEDYDPRTTMVLCDGRGAPRVGFTVSHDGTLALTWDGEYCGSQFPERTDDADPESP